MSFSSACQRRTWRLALRIFSSVLAIATLLSQSILQAQETETEDQLPPDAVERYERGDVEGAIAQYDKAIESNPGDAQAYLERARIYLDQKKFSNVMDDTTHAIMLHRLTAVHLSDAYCMRALARINDGDFQAALADCNNAINAAPKNAAGYNNRARVRLATHDWKGVVTDSNTAMSLKPNSALPYYNRGFAYSHLNNNAQAMADWEKAIQIEPGYRAELEPHIAKARAAEENQPAEPVGSSDTTAALPPTSASPLIVEASPNAAPTSGSVSGKPSDRRFGANIKTARVPPASSQSTPGTAPSSPPIDLASATAESAKTPPPLPTLAPNPFEPGTTVTAMRTPPTVITKSTPVATAPPPKIASTTATPTKTPLPLPPNPFRPGASATPLRTTPPVIAKSTAGPTPLPERPGSPAPATTLPPKIAATTTTPAKTPPPLPPNPFRPGASATPVRMTPPVIAKSTSPLPTAPRLGAWESPPKVVAATAAPSHPAATAKPAATSPPIVVAALSPKPPRPPPAASASNPPPKKTPAAATAPPVNKRAPLPPPKKSTAPIAAGAHGRPEAVLAAIKKNISPSSSGRDEPVANGAFIVRRPNYWQVADETDDRAIFVSQDLPNTAVTFQYADNTETEESAFPERRLPGTEELPNGEIGDAAARRYAWVEMADKEKREALEATWRTGHGLMQATAIAPSSVWQQHPEKILALLNGRAGERKAPTPKPKPGASETPIATFGITPTPPPTPTPTATPSPTEDAGLPRLVVASLVTKGVPPFDGGELQTTELADGAVKIRYDPSWEMSDSSDSYAVLKATKSANLGVWLEWRKANDSVDGIANSQLQKLRGRYARVQQLPNRTVGGQPARQLAWLTGDGGERRETLEVDWIENGMMLRATVSAPPDVWKKDGPKVLQLFEEIGGGG
jgi:Tfp pilus assembly protein PilF